KRLISGVDVWLNTPTRPLEASGTSGEKAVMNGVLNFSVKDGWWYEGYKEGAGWALTEKRAFENQGFQDELDAITIYSILENEIIPLYYDRNEKGIPTGWLKYVKNNIAQIAPEFTTRRMINDYEDRFYSPMFERITKLRDSDNQLAKDIALWKRRVLAGWNYVEVKSIVTPKIGIKELGLGEVYEVEVVIDHKALEDVEFGIEMLMVEAAEEQSPKIVHSEPFEVVKREGSLVTYVMKYKLNLPGSYKFGIRLYPHNENLPHKQDFNLVRWI
ncbi:MAG: glycosyltransferase family 1 protein, partial [Bacteroidales bacterium]|nr:glycosyltransferase family 1 protein [Bacteroidales bacterium]